MHLLLNKLHN